MFIQLKLNASAHTGRGGEETHGSIQILGRLLRLLSSAELVKKGKKGRSEREGASFCHS